MAKPGDCPDQPSWLDVDEQSRCDRFTVATARRRYLLSHCFLRAVLSRTRPAIEPHQWHYVQGEYGRPELDAASQALADPNGQQRLRFNLSHTEELFAVIVTDDADCGVDVETTTRSTDLVGVGKRSFAEQEFADFMAATGDARRQRFFEYWTLKESYIKAIGTGLSTPLRNFSFDVTSQEPKVSFVPEHDDQPERWSFGLQRPTPNEQLAWCIEQMTVEEPTDMHDSSQPAITWFDS